MPYLTAFVLAAQLANAALQSAQADPRIEDARRNESWVARYNKALDEIRRERYDEAIALLRTAIAIDPEAQPNRIVAKGVYENYFPHYYLSIAYLKSGQVAKAREYYNLRGPLTQKLVAEAKAFEQELIRAEQLQH